MNVYNQKHDCVWYSELFTRKHTTLGFQSGISLDNTLISGVVTTLKLPEIPLMQLSSSVCTARHGTACYDIISARVRSTVAQRYVCLSLSTHVDTHSDKGIV